MPFVNPTLMIRTSVFRDIGFYSDEFRVAEDYELVCRAAKYGVGFDNIQRVLLRKIENASSISRRRRTGQLVNRLQILVALPRPRTPLPARHAEDALSYGCARRARRQPQAGCSRAPTVAPTRKRCMPARPQNGRSDWIWNQPP